MHINKNQINIMKCPEDDYFVHLCFRELSVQSLFNKMFAIVETRSKAVVHIHEIIKRFNCTKHEKKYVRNYTIHLEQNY